MSVLCSLGLNFLHVHQTPSELERHVSEEEAVIPQQHRILISGQDLLQLCAPTSFRFIHRLWKVSFKFVGNQKPKLQDERSHDDTTVISAGFLLWICLKDESQNLHKRTNMVMTRLLTTETRADVLMNEFPLQNMMQL